MEKEDTDLQALQNIFVYTLGSKVVVRVSDFYANHRIVLVVFRRFGCVICREAAVEISKLKHDLDRMNVRLIGVGFEKNEKDVYDFLMYWAGELYIDEQRELYKALNVKRFGLLEAYGLVDPKVYDNLARAKAAGMRGSRWGADPFQLGGTFVIGPSPHGMLYAHRQKFYGDLANNNEVLAACSTPTFVLGVYDHHPT
eukprot:Phypoly_transcript_14416.p1 GENE.Phypoly_transcript_14416~~Phypoly_transcript_14416.p1  ORF type:complete len:198 (+),score=25.40 Phypoly_transcript_14416:102-695(+)